MRLDVFLAELLHEHDCVIVPGFGGLVASYRPARLNAITHFITPPAKHIGFNRNLVRNDGLLANHIAHVLDIPYASALSQIEDCIADYRKQLEAEARVVWDKIGFLFLDKTGNLQFIPDEQENFLKDSFGLQGLQLRPVMQQPESARVVEMQPVAATRGKSTIWIAAAAIALPVIAAGLFFVMQSTHRNGEQLSIADLNPFTRANTSQYVPRKNTEPVQHEIPPIENSLNKVLAESKSDTVRFSFSTDGINENGIAVIKEKSYSGTPAQITEGKKASPPTSEKRSNPISATGQFALIAGAFQVEQNADNFIARLTARGFTAHHAGTSRGLSLVAIGSYNTKAEAQNALRILRDGEGIKVWVKRMN